MLRKVRSIYEFHYFKLLVFTSVHEYTEFPKTNE